MKLLMVHTSFVDAKTFIAKDRPKVIPPGGGGTSYNGLYGEAPPERGAFFRLQVYKRVGKSVI